VRLTETVGNRIGFTLQRTLQRALYGRYSRIVCTIYTVELMRFSKRNAVNGRLTAFQY